MSDFIDNLSFLDTATGLEYSGNMEDLYLEILEEYVDSTPAESLQEMYDAANWAEYRVIVHGIKSTSKTIGATEIGERAMELEFAARDGEIDKILSKHAQFLMDYKELVKQIAGAIA